MKKILLFGLACIIGLAVTAQTSQLKSSVPTAKKVTEQTVGMEPVKAGNLPVNSGPAMTAGDGVDVVSVITIGTAANAYGYGYAGGQKTMVWADNDLGAIINFHRMGPGATPPGFSGYLGFDLGVNKGMTAGDWTVNNQAYASNLNNGGTYYLDAGRYPQAVIYNPIASKGIDDAYVAFFAPNLSNTISTWGGYSYGVAKLTDPADSTKHLYWYDAPPYTYIPDGMMLTHGGDILVTDLDQDWSSGALVYNGGIIVSHGVWDATEMDFVYTMDVIEHPTLDNNRPANERIASSGDVVWIVSLANTGDLPPVGGVQERFYPVMFKSVDGGMNWSDPINVQLDGPDGIDAIKNFLSDYRIEQLYTPPLPTRDEIPYTTAFDCDIVVDKWGNPHIGVVVGVSADGYSIATGDSSYAVFDVFSNDGGTTWCAVLMGNPWTFRGTFGDLTEDNRVNMSRNAAGDKVFATWIDTQVPGVTDNINPDIFARGFDLVTNKITAEPENVTFLSDVTQQAYFATASYYTFADGSNDIVPLVAELLSDPNDPAQPVTFKYIPDFSYAPGDYTVDAGPCNFPIAVENRKAESSISVYPNPVTDMAVVKVNLTESANVKISVSNMLGQNVLALDKGFVAAGAQQFTLNASQFNSGVYFVTVQINAEKHTQKVIVK